MCTIICFNFFRITSNYEYAENSVLPLKTIQENIYEAKLELSSNALGKLIKIIWREKVEYRKSTSDYVNLKVRAKTRERRHINDLDDDALKEIQLLCHKRGWLFDHSQIDKKVVSMMRLADQTSDEYIHNGAWL